MNIFEGARRVSKIVFAIIVLIGILSLIGTNPHVFRQYAKLGDELIRVDTCGNTPMYRVHTEGVPEWVSIYVCGSDDGPKMIELSDAELVKLDDEIYGARFKSYGQVVVVTFLSALIFGIFVWCTGWVARGFMGIPRGLDKKA